MLTIKLLNEQAQLNDFFYVETKEYIPGIPFKINLQIQDQELGQRLMAGTAAKMICLFQKRDGTTLTKTAAPLFNPNDMSMWQISMSAADATDIVGSNFQVILDMTGDSTQPDLSDASDLRSGMAYSVLAKVTFDGEC